jgi:single-strand DNA-binding protein
MLQGFVVGRVGKDAELKSMQDGTPVSNFSVAVNVGRGDRKKTLWIDCALWGKQAESLTEYLTKGKQVALQGQLDVRAWFSDKDHEAHANIQLSVSEVTLCGSAPQDRTKPA